MKEVARLFCRSRAALAIGAILSGALAQAQSQTPIQFEDNWRLVEKHGTAFGLSEYEKGPNWSGNEVSADSYDARALGRLPEVMHATAVARKSSPKPGSDLNLSLMVGAFPKPIQMKLDDQATGISQTVASRWSPLSTEDCAVQDSYVVGGDFSGTPANTAVIFRSFTFYNLPPGNCKALLGGLKQKIETASAASFAPKDDFWRFLFQTGALDLNRMGDLQKVGIGFIYDITQEPKSEREGHPVASR